MSHTTYDGFHNKTADLKMWIIHNSDWSGEASVIWKDEKSGATWEWKVFGHKLTTGFINDYKPTPDLIEGPVHLSRVTVPYSIIGRAVALAVRTFLTMEIVNYVENL